MLNFLMVQAPLIGLSQLEILNTDFMAAYNRYPEILSRISIIQYEPDRIAFDEDTNEITVRR